MTPNLIVVVAASLFSGPLPSDPPPAASNRSQPEASRLELMPHPSVFRMASRVRAIVEGTATAKGVVTVTKRHLVREGDVIGATIRVPSLAGMPKTGPILGGLGGLGRQPVKAESVLLFLEDNPKEDVWVPLHLIGKAARGVLWFEKNSVWGYAQAMNPGGYSLSRWVFHRPGGAVDATPKAVRGALAAGIAGRKRWQQMLDIEDKGERAKALMKWFDPATSPDGEWWRERLWPDCQRACDALGEAAVRPLARLVQSAGADAAAAAADVLHRQGARARAAAPSLIARLRDLRGVDPILLLRVLGRIADPRTEHVLRDYIAHDDPFVAIEAARGLHGLGAKDVVRLLEARMPTEVVDAVGLSVVANMLQLIHDIEPKRAEKLVADHFLQTPQLLMQRGWLRRIRDRQ